MSGFDSVAVVDWSAANDRGARPTKDAIWAAVVVQGTAHEPVYLRNRDAAVTWICDLIETERAAGRRLMIGFDFPFGYPAGFAKAVTGSSDPLGVWAMMARELEDTPKANNRFALAGALNARLPGVGPFWFNGLKNQEIPHLPHKGNARDGLYGLPEKRVVETQAEGSFSCWQMGGAGAVGGQVMTGMAALWKVKTRFKDVVSIWPFEGSDAPVVFTEIWPSLLSDLVAAEGDTIKDRAQVRLLATALARLPDDILAQMLDVDAPEEGWILGVGHEDQLRAALMAPRRLRDDCFALPPGVDWVPVDSALELLKQAVAPVVETRPLAVTQAVGRILAGPVAVLRANPPRPNAAVDGYGFAHAVTGDGPQLMRLQPGRAAAGAAFDGAVPRGLALRILTGAALPEGVDTVVLEEDCALGPDHIAFQGPVKPGANTRKAGEDVAPGDTLFEAGHRLRPPDLATLIAAGVAQVDVFAPLRVGVLSTGDELVDAGGNAGAGGSLMQIARCSCRCCRPGATPLSIAQ